MATYAVGDVQGCWESLQALLEEISYTSADTLLFCGDLVNRGPHSLEVLRWARDTGVQLVLGNHDLHLVGCHTGVRRAKARDTFQDVLDAPDADELIEWLCEQPLLIDHENWSVVHAGVNPTWPWKQIRTLAAEIHEALAPSNRAAFLEASYRKPAIQWSDDLTPPERWGALFHTFTRIRVCTASGDMDLSFKLGPGWASNGYQPWYEHESPRGKKRTIVFGHWSALGFHQADGAVCLDTGCVWGGELTALRLDDNKVFQVESLD